MRVTPMLGFLGALLCGTSSLVPAARAGELTHIVTPGATLGDIAELYYGDAARSDLLRAVNELESTTIAVGSKLRIPVTDLHAVVAGDSWSELAARYWGDASLHAKLAEQVSGSSAGALRIGAELSIPALIRYRLRPGQTLAGVSRIFLGTSTRSAELARFNGIQKPRRLQIGAKLLIPVTNLQPHGTLPSPSADVAAPAAESALSFGAPLRHAVNAYMDGDYDGALEKLEKIRGQVLAEGKLSEQSLLLRHLVFTYAAFDRNAAACDSYRALVALDRDFRWNPDEISPKILRVTGSCQIE